MPDEVCCPVTTIVVRDEQLENSVDLAAAGVNSVQQKTVSFCPHVGEGVLLQEVQELLETNRFAKR